MIFGLIFEIFFVGKILKIILYFSRFEFCFLLTLWSWGSFQFRSVNRSVLFGLRLFRSPIAEATNPRGRKHSFYWNWSRNLARKIVFAKSTFRLVAPNKVCIFLWFSSWTVGMGPKTGRWWMFPPWGCWSLDWTLCRLSSFRRYRVSLLILIPMFRLFRSMPIE